jgi:hypothetical protein
LDIFKSLFGKIIIAEAVYAEIKAKQGYGYKVLSFCLNTLINTKAKVSYILKMPVYVVLANKQV